MKTQKKRLLALALTAALVIGILPVSALAEYFSDTRWHWAEEAIEEWAAYGILGGYGDGTFLPDRNITRAEMAKILDVMIGYQDIGSVSFPDVTADRWFYEHVLRLATAGVMEGSLGKALPDNPITRQEAVVLIARAFRVTGAQANADPFLDEAAVADWAIDHVRAMKSHGYIQGTYNEFKPTDNITRAELVTILDNMFPGYYNAKGEYESTAKKVIGGNTAVSASGVTLKNMEIEGDLYLLQGIADGEVRLEDVTVKGQVHVWGGGEDSLYFDHCTLQSLTVGIDGVKVVYEDGTKAEYTNAGAGELVIGKGCRVESLTVDADAEISIAQGATVDKLEQTGGAVVSNGVIKELEQWDGVVENGAKGEISLYTVRRDVASMRNDGMITKAVIEADSAYRNNGTTREMVINAPADITGDGLIETARVNADGVTFDMEPRDVYVDGSVTTPPKFDEEWDDSQELPPIILNSVSAIYFEGQSTVWVKLAYSAEAADFTVTVDGVTLLANRDYTVAKAEGNLYQLRLNGVTLSQGSIVSVAGKSPLSTTARTETYKALLTLDSIALDGKNGVQVTLNAPAALTAADLSRFILRHSVGQEETVLIPTGLTKISDRVYAITFPSLDGKDGVLKVKSANEKEMSFDFSAPVLNSGAIGGLGLTGNAGDTVIADGDLTLQLLFSEKAFKHDAAGNQQNLTTADLSGGSTILRLTRSTGAIDFTDATLDMTGGIMTITLPRAALGIGVYTLTVDTSRLYDDAGNQGSGSTTYRFTVGGGAAPVITGQMDSGSLVLAYTATGFEGYHNAVRQITIIGEQTYTIPVSAIAKASGRLTISRASLPASLEGDYLVQISATGYLTAQVAQVTLDTTPPSLPAATVSFDGTVFEGKLLEGGFFELVFSETLGNPEALPDALLAALGATADQAAVHINGAAVTVTVQTGQSLTLGTFTLAPGTVTDAHGNGAGSISFALDQSNRPQTPQLAGDMTVPVSWDTPVTLTAGYSQFGVTLYAVPVAEGVYNLDGRVEVQAADVTGETVTVNLPAGAYRLFAAAGAGTRVLYSAPSTAAITASGEAALSLSVTKGSGIGIAVTDTSTASAKALTVTATGTVAHAQNIIHDSLIPSFAQEIAEDSKLPLSNHYTFDGQFTAIGLELYTLLTGRLGLEDTVGVTVEQTNPALKLYKDKGDGNISESGGVYTKTSALDSLTAQSPLFEMLLKSGSAATLTVKKGAATLVTVTVDGTGLTLNAPTDATLKALDEIRGAAMIGDEGVRNARLDALGTGADYFAQAGFGDDYIAANKDRYIISLKAASGGLTTRAAIVDRLKLVNKAKDQETNWALIKSHMGKGIGGGTAAAGSFSAKSTIVEKEDLKANFAAAQALTQEVFESVLNRTVTESEVKALRAIVLMSRAEDIDGLDLDLQAALTPLIPVTEYSVRSDKSKNTGYRTQIKDGFATVNLTGGFGVDIKAGTLTYSDTPYTSGGSTGGHTMVGGVDVKYWESDLTIDGKAVSHMAVLADRTETKDTVLYRANAAGEGRGYYDNFGQGTMYKCYLGRMYGSFGKAENGTLTPYADIGKKHETYYTVYFDANDQIIGYSVTEISFAVVT